MNKQIITITCMILLLLTLSGCGSESDHERFIIETTTGLQGITLELISNSPPSQVYEGDSFQAILKIDNKGHHDVYGGMVRFVVEDDYVSITGPEVENYDLEGKSPQRGQGEFDIFTFSAEAKRIDPLISEKPVLLMFHSCYTYKTKFYESVCIDTDPMKDITKGCIPTPVKIYTSGQGAPLAVTKLETDVLHVNPYEVAPQFTITIENKGRGQVLETSSYQKACGSESFSRDEMGVYEATVYLHKLGEPVKLDCTPSIFKLREGKDTIRCRAEEGYEKDGSAFTSPLTVELVYGYTETLTAPMTIKRTI